MAGPGTTITGPLISGSIWNPGDPRGNQNTGLAQLQQSITLQAASAATVTGVLYLPYGSQIDDFNIDTLTAWTSTTAYISVGTAASGTQYLGNGTTSAKSAGRLSSEQSLAFTGAQLTAMANIGANTAVYFTMTSTGATNTGTTLCTIFYVQTVQLSQGEA